MTVPFSADCPNFHRTWGFGIQFHLQVPVSLDFALQMGESATMSGFYLSSPIIGSIVWASVQVTIDALIGPHCLIQGWHHYRRLGRCLKCIGRLCSISKPSKGHVFFRHKQNTLYSSLSSRFMLCLWHTPLFLKTGSSWSVY